MADSYFPRQQARALIWMKTFSAALVADGQRYMVSPADAAAIDAAVGAADAALTVSSDPATRTAVSVRTKDELFVAAEQICRQFYSLIKVNAGVSDADKVAIGVRPLNRGRTPVTCPQSSPRVSVIAATMGRQVLCYGDSLLGDSARKPFGATALQLFRAVGDVRAADPQEARFYGSFTRSPVSVAFDAADAGRVATYFARWTSRSGDVGPWSLPAAMRIVA